MRKWILQKAKNSLNQSCQSAGTMEVPHVSQEVSLHSKDQPSVARGVCRTLLKDWGKLSDDDIEVRTLTTTWLHCLQANHLAVPNILIRTTLVPAIQVTKVSGGITNVLLKLQPADCHQLEPVLFRIFGDKTDLLIDREQEARVILQLNAAGFGAQVRNDLHTASLILLLLVTVILPRYDSFRCELADDQVSLLGSLLNSGSQTAGRKGRDRWAVVQCAALICCGRDELPLRVLCLKNNFWRAKLWPQCFLLKACSTNDGDAGPPWPAADWRASLTPERCPGQAR